MPALKLLQEWPEPSNSHPNDECRSPAPRLEIEFVAEAFGSAGNDLRHPAVFVGLGHSDDDAHHQGGAQKSPAKALVDAVSEREKRCHHVYLKVISKVPSVPETSSSVRVNILEEEHVGPPIVDAVLASARCVKAMTAAGPGCIPKNSRSHVGKYKCGKENAKHFQRH
mmetsp:Transcript_126023/g.245828  ORF Transcript_126023/g.245828 Transcript_126023/m.245828 type:complete len:168 (+) Transcript_126023:615-1118(+)